MQSNRLTLNADKTECDWETTRQRQSTFAAPNVTVGGSIIVPSKGARNLRVFSKQQAWSEVAHFQHLSNMLLSTSIVANSSPITATIDFKTLLHAFVSCRFDYCSSLYADVLSCDTAQLQSVQCAAARLFVSKYDSVTPVLRDVLNWLPIKERITVKIRVLT